MISIITWCLAAVFNSLMDAVENENFYESRLKNWDQKFWYKRESWKHAKKIGSYRIDAWHLAKSCMIICMALTAIFFDWPVKKWQDAGLYLIVAGVSWNVVFWLFYHKIFGVK